MSALGGDTLVMIMFCRNRPVKQKLNVVAYFFNSVPYLLSQKIQASSRLSLLLYPAVI